MKTTTQTLDEMVCCRLTPEYAERLRKVALAEDRKMADVARRLIREGIDRYTKKAERK